MKRYEIEDKESEELLEKKLKRKLPEGSYRIAGVFKRVLEVEDKYSTAAEKVIKEVNDKMEQYYKDTEERQKAEEELQQMQEIDTE
jgi:hypothetical protein